jgi:hypothetical protein
MLFPVPSGSDLVDLIQVTLPVNTIQEYQQLLKQLI